MSERLNYPALAKGSYQALYQLSTVNKTDFKLRHLVNLRASQINGCAFCVDMHVKEAKIDGESELRLHHLAIWRESPLFSPKERAAFDLTEKLTANLSHGIDDTTFQQLTQHFTEEEIAELVFAITVINSWNRLSITFLPEPGKLDAQLGLDRAGLS